MAVLIDPPAPPIPFAGLLGAAVGPLPMPAHATASSAAGVEGIQYVMDSCGNAAILPIACGPLTRDYDQDPDGLFTATPFTVQAAIQCGAAGWTMDEIEARARRRLQLSEGKAVERAFWGGTEDVPGYLQSWEGTAEVLPQTNEVARAISGLEQALADNYGLPGYIHAQPGMAAWLANTHLIHWEGSTPKTPRGNTYVFGDGYSGQGPDGSTPDAGTGWIFATGRVITWRSSDVFVPPTAQVFERSTNRVTASAERDYMLGVECFVGAVLVGGAE